jgi:hypothetical protein
MTVYQGIVKGNVVLLPEEVHLQDGTKVEVTVVPANIQGHRSPESLEAAEEAFKQHLLEAGLILEIKRPPLTEPEGNRRPIKVKGKPMSQTIIEDRR